MKTRIVMCIALIIVISLYGGLIIQAHAHKEVASVCTDMGLTGTAQQENLLFCSTNGLNGIVTNGAGSVYQASIHLAQSKHIIVGTPTSVVGTVDWVNIPITYVTFTSGYHAEHYNPSNGHVRIYDSSDRLVWSE